MAKNNETIVNGDVVVEKTVGLDVGLIKDFFGLDVTAYSRVVVEIRKMRVGFFKADGRFYYDKFLVKYCVKSGKLGLTDEFYENCQPNSVKRSSGEHSLFKSFERYLDGIELDKSVGFYKLLVDPNSFMVALKQTVKTVSSSAKWDFKVRFIMFNSWLNPAETEKVMNVLWVTVGYNVKSPDELDSALDKFASDGGFLIDK